MEIYVDNKLAVLKKGTSFDFVSENRYFSGAGQLFLVDYVPSCRMS